jgi:hypothetical protein
LFRIIGITPGKAQVNSPFEVAEQLRRVVLDGHIYRGRLITRPLGFYNSANDGEPYFMIRRDEDNDERRLDFVPGEIGRVLLDRLVALYQAG